MVSKDLTCFRCIDDQSVLNYQSVLDKITVKIKELNCGFIFRWRK